MDRSILVAFVDQVLDALAGTEGEMVVSMKSEHAGNGLAAPFQLFLGKRGRCAGGHFQSPFDDLLRRTAHTAGKRRFQQLLPVGCELDRHRFQYNLAEAAAGLRERDIEMNNSGKPAPDA